MPEVNMLAEAKNAQWSAKTFLGPDAIKVVAPAKVNLFLGVGKRLDSGYHEVVNVMHALALHDILYMSSFHEASEDEAEGAVRATAGNCSVERGNPEALLKSSPNFAFAGPNKNIRVTIDIASKTHTAFDPEAQSQTTLNVPVEDNLIFRAIDDLAKAIDRTTSEHVLIHLEKHIPHQAGLGGGSSDAAAALAGMVELWGLSSDDECVREVASSIGADVAFFLKGGCALYTGIGEHFDHSLEPMRLPVVLVKPNAGVSTSAAYKEFDNDPAPIPTELELQTLYAASADKVPLYNNLEPAAQSLLPELKDIRNWLSESPEVVEFKTESDLRATERFESVYSDEQSDELNQFDKMESQKAILLCGSGSTTFAIARSAQDARELVAKAQREGWWARATSLSALKAQCAKA